MHLRYTPFIMFVVLVFAGIMLASLSINMDLHLHDTYYVIQGYFLPACSLFCLLIIWFLYVRNANRIKNQRVALLHLALSVGLLLGIAVLPGVYFFVSQEWGVPRRYYAGFSFERYSNPVYYGELLVLAFVLLLLVQSLFLFNLKRPLLDPNTPKL